MVLNDEQLDYMKTLMNQYLLDNDDYLQLPAPTAISVLQCIIDNEAFNNSTQLLEGHKIGRAVVHLRHILSHECPQNVGKNDTEEADEPGYRKYFRDNGEEVVEKEGLLGITILNDESAEAVTRSDVIRYIVDRVENELIVQQRILKRNRNTKSSKSDVNITHSTSTEPVVLTPHFSSETQAFWDDVLALVESDTLYKDEIALNQKGVQMADDVAETICGELVIFLAQATLHPNMDLAFLLTIKAALVWIKSSSVQQRMQLLCECLDELENGAPLQNQKVQKNLMVLLYCIRGVMYMNADQITEAFEDFTKATALDPTYVQAINNKALIYQFVKKHDEAIEEYTRALEILPDYVGPLRNRASLLFDLCRFPLAFKDYCRIIELMPNDFESLNNRGVVYQTMYKHETAIEDFNAALAINPRYLLAYLNRSESYCFLKRHHDAIEDLSSIIELEPTYEKAYLLRSACYEDMGMFAESMRDLQKAWNLNPESQDCERSKNRLVSLIEYKVDDFLDQVEDIVFDSTYNLYTSPTRTCVENICKSVLSAIFNVKGAEESTSDLSKHTEYYLKKYSQFLESRNLHSASRKMNAELDVRMNAITRERTVYEMLNAISKIENIPEREEECYLIKFATLGARSADASAELIADCLAWLKTKKHLLHKLKYRNMYTLAHGFSGLVKMHREDIPAAIDDFTTSFQNDPEYATSLCNRGICYFLTGRGLEAEADLTRTIEIDADYCLPYFFRGFLYQREQQYLAALADLTKALELDVNKEIAQRQQAVDTIEEIKEYIQEYYEFQIKQAVSEGACTFSVTGERYVVHNKIFECRTCSTASDGEVEVCESCASHCHNGHELVEKNDESFYCDCGSRRAPHPCQCLPAKEEDQVEE